MKIDRTEVVAAICNRMDALHLRHAIVFDPKATHANIPYIPIAEALATGLAEANPTAVIIARALVGPSDLEPGPFWAMPFGQLLFLAGGWREQTVPQAMAASLLGCSRQWVSTLVRKGELDATTDDARRVYVEQVKEMLKAKIDK